MFYHCSCISSLVRSREGRICCGERILLEPCFFYVVTAEVFVEVEESSVRVLIPLIH